MMNTAYQTKFTATIANGAQDSDAIEFKDFAQGGFMLPATFTGASMSFKVSNDNVTYAPLHDSSDALISITVTQGRAYAFPIGSFGFAYLKLRSASAEGGARSIDVGLKY